MPNSPKNFNDYIVVDFSIFVSLINLIGAELLDLLNLWLAQKWSFE